MPNYRRNRVPGETYFFTVNLLERKLELLVEHIDDLREAVRVVREKQPFHIDAWVVMSGSHACDPDITYGRRSIFGSMAGNQKGVYQIDPEN